MEPHPVDIYVGKRLRARRTILGMSQEDVGDAVGITFQQVQKYERGLNRVGSSRLYELALFLKIDISYFFAGYEKPYSDYNNAFAEDSSNFEYEEYNNKEVMNIIKAYYNIKNPSVRKKVLALIKSVSSMENEYEKSHTKQTQEV